MERLPSACRTIVRPGAVTAKARRGQTRTHEVGSLDGVSGDQFMRK